MKIKRHMKGMLRYLRSTRAVSALEYAILIGVVATAIAAALTTFSAEITTALSNIAGCRIGDYRTNGPWTTFGGTN